MGQPENLSAMNILTWRKKTTTTFYVRPLSIVKIWRANRGEYNENERTLKNSCYKRQLEMIASENVIKQPKTYKTQTNMEKPNVEKMNVEI